MDPKTGKKAKKADAKKSGHSSSVRKEEAKTNPKKKQIDFKVIEASGLNPELQNEHQAIF